MVVLWQSCGRYSNLHPCWVWSSGVGLVWQVWRGIMCWTRWWVIDYFRYIEFWQWMFFIYSLIKCNQYKKNLNLSSYFLTNSTTHSKIERLFLFQKVDIQILPIYVYLPFKKVKPCTLMNNPRIVIQNTLASDYFRILHIIHTKSQDPKITTNYPK